MQRLRIGISSCFFYAGTVHQHKTFMYAERELYQWIASAGAIPYLIPDVGDTINGLNLHDVISDLDAVILSGGVDVSPKSYGEKPLKPEWEGDYYRDQYEIEIFNTARELAKPILGICRGHQLINVALGGTLYQDLNEQEATNVIHRDADIYDNLKHEMKIMPETELARIFPDITNATINTVHHQAIKDLGEGLIVQALSTPDNIIESIWLEGSKSYVMGVQWHPEWIKDSNLLPSRNILDHFLAVAKDI